MNLNSAASVGDLVQLRESIDSIPSSELATNLNRRNLHGMTPLHAAVFFDQLEAASLLLEKGAQVDRLSCTSTSSHCVWTAPLHLAAAVGTIRMVKLLVQAGADATLRDVSGQTPLQIAQCAGNKGGETVLKEALESLRPPNEWPRPTIGSAGRNSVRYLRRDGEASEGLFVIHEHFSQSASPKLLPQVRLVRSNSLTSCALNRK